MTTLTLQLSDELVFRAKTLGVFDELGLSHLVSEFLNKQIHEADTAKSIAKSAVRHEPRFPVGLMTGQITLAKDFDEPLDELFTCLNDNTLSDGV
ncbi:MAG: hypothetical protein Q4G13_03555 [Moraxella sp.]|nr:hypothetical protein [Moraxella sp.]